MFEQSFHSDEPKRKLSREEKGQVLEPILKAMESDQVSLGILLKQKVAELKAMKEKQKKTPEDVDAEEMKELEEYVRNLRLRTRGDA